MTSNCSFPLGDLLTGADQGGKWYLKTAPAEYSVTGSDCTENGVAPDGNGNGANKIKRGNTCATACDNTSTVIPNAGANGTSNQIPYTGTAGQELNAGICPDGLPPGTYELEYVVEIGGCSSTTATSFDVLEQPHAGCDYEFEVCENDTTDWKIWNLLRGDGDHNVDLCFDEAITLCGFSCDVAEHDTMQLAPSWYEDCNVGADQWTTADLGFHTDVHTNSCDPSETTNSTFNVNEAGGNPGDIFKFCYQAETNNADPPPNSCGDGCCRDCACITITVIAAPETGSADPKTVCN